MTSRIPFSFNNVWRPQILPYSLQMWNQIKKKKQLLSRYYQIDVLNPLGTLYVNVVRIK
jgi:hypothetical protein